MKPSLFDFYRPHPEPSTMVAFAENSLDRQSEHRAADCLERAFKAENVHAFALAGGKLVVKHDEKIIDPLFAPYELAELDPIAEDAILLGYLKNGEPRLAIPVRADPDTLQEPLKATDGRTLYRQQMLDDDLLGQFAQASSLMNWNGTNRFCGKCGSPTRAEIGGYRRVCEACNHTIFPRTDPVAIMLVIDIERDLCLLGRSPHFQPGIYSCLAGFLEPGETIEHTVRRETLEESGIKVGRVLYHASQPWPMPHTLMIGCYAEAISFDIRRDETELEDCRWFTREETRAMVERSSLSGPVPDTTAPPPKGAIAHRLMRDWLDWKMD